MRADLLHVITVIFNPIQWATRIEHYERFKEHMLAAGVKLYVVECALRHRPFLLGNDPRIVHIPVRANTLAWNKENLGNIALPHLPVDAEYIGLFDADIEFNDPEWAVKTVHALQQYPVVQPWGEALDLGPDGSIMLIKGRHVQTSFAKVWRHQGDVKPQKNADPLNPYAYPHPGYAWAYRREVLEATGGFIEVSGLGAGDHQMAMSFVGKIEKAIHGQTHTAYQDAIRAWGQRAFSIVGGRLGYVAGRIEHFFHGDKEKRMYHDRWQILIKHKFNPLTDIRKNMYGVIELAGNKPEMEMDFDRYFRQRDEDANILL